MDRSASPWRVLDDAAVVGSTPADAAAPNGDGARGPASLRVSARLIGGIVGAGVLAVAAFVVAASGSTDGGVTVDNGAVVLDASARPAAGSASPSFGDVVVDVQGAVLQPGVHHLAGGSRVADAIAAAGGYGPRVDAVRAGRELNLAAQLHDGDRVLVPSRDDPPETAGGGSGSSAAGGGSTAGGSSGSVAGGSAGGSGAGGLVDLNHATASELDALPGVGPVTAQKIIAAREEQPFATIEALRDRKVIGASAFDKLKDLVTVKP
jgi:competence protein ComEA